MNNCGLNWAFPFELPVSSYLANKQLYIAKRSWAICRYFNFVSIFYINYETNLLTIYMLNWLWNPLIFVSNIFCKLRYAHNFLTAKRRLLKRTKKNQSNKSSLQLQMCFWVGWKGMVNDLQHDFGLKAFKIVSLCGDGANLLLLWW